MRKKSQKKAEEEALSVGIRLVSIYKNARTHCDYECLSCFYEFSKRPGEIKQEQGCPRCSGKIRTQADCEKDAEKQGLIFKSIYSGRNKEVHNYSCKTCFYDFPMRPNAVQAGQSCPKCAGKIRTQADCEKDADLVNLVFKSIYSGSVKDFHNYSCKTCFYEFPSIPNSVQQKHGCPRCALRYDKWEKHVFNTLFNELPHLISKAKGLLKNKRFHTDVWDPVNRKALELDGDYWHEKPIQKESDIRKNQEYKDAKITLLRIKYSEYKRDPENTIRSIVKFFAGEINCQ